MNQKVLIEILCLKYIAINSLYLLIFNLSICRNVSSKFKPVDMIGDQNFSWCPQVTDEIQFSSGSKLQQKSNAYRKHIFLSIAKLKSGHDI